MEKICKNCEHARPVPLETKALQCFGAPPSVVPMVQNIPGFGTQVTMASVFPAVEPESSCGTWKEKTTPAAGNETGKNVVIAQGKGGANGKA